VDNILDTIINDIILARLKVKTKGIKEFILDAIIDLNNIILNGLKVRTKGIKRIKNCKE